MRQWRHELAPWGWPQGWAPGAPLHPVLVNQADPPNRTARDVLVAIVQDPGVFLLYFCLCSESTAVFDPCGLDSHSSPWLIPWN